MEAINLQTDLIQKRFGGVVALRNGSLEVKSGEVVALVGANGSGKSTLTKIITGVLSKDDGEIIYNSETVSFPNPLSAKTVGITAVYQELSLIPSMTVAENIWLAHEPLTKTGRIDARKFQGSVVNRDVDVVLLADGLDNISQRFVEEVELGNLF